MRSALIHEGFMESSPRPLEQWKLVVRIPTKKENI